MTCPHSSPVLHQHATSRPPAQLQMREIVLRRVLTGEEYAFGLPQISTYAQGLPSCAGSKRRCTAKARVQSQNSNGSNNNKGSSQEQQADTQVRLPTGSTMLHPNAAMSQDSQSPAWSYVDAAEQLFCFLQHQASLQEVAQQCFEDSPDTKARCGSAFKHTAL